LDDIPTGALFGALILLILFSAFFSGSETALMTLNRYRLRHLADQGHRRARLAETLLKRPDRLISCSATTLSTSWPPRSLPSSLCDSGGKAR
jgi:Mg2+/Co2+ transporter CorB